MAGSCVLVVLSFMLLALPSLIEGYCRRPDYDDEWDRQLGVHVPRGSYREWRGIDVGDTKNCSCWRGRQTESGNCTVVCTETGWNLTEPCVPLPCSDPPEIPLAAVINANDTWEILATAQYKCADGYYQQGQNTRQCFIDDVNKNATSGVWYKFDEEMCVDCGAPPNITNGVLVKVSTTTEGGIAEYACAEGAQMLGTGRAYCFFLKWEHQSAERKYRKPTWTFVPECLMSKCLVPQGKQGDSQRSLVKVTQCMSRADAGYPLVTCEQPETFLLRKAAQNKNMLFYGSEMCAVQETKHDEVYREESRLLETRASGLPTNTCDGICIAGVAGYGEMVTDQLVTYSPAGVAVVKNFTRYETMEIADE